MILYCPDCQLHQHFLQLHQDQQLRCCLPCLDCQHHLGCLDCQQSLQSLQFHLVLLRHSYHYCQGYLHYLLYRGYLRNRPHLQCHPDPRYQLFQQYHQLPQECLQKYKKPQLLIDFLVRLDYQPCHLVLRCLDYQRSLDYQLLHPCLAMSLEQPLLMYHLSLQYQLCQDYPQSLDYQLRHLYRAML